MNGNSATADGRRGGRAARGGIIDVTFASAAVTYLVWRIGWTLDSSTLVPGIAMVALEAWGLFELGLLAWAAGERRRSPAADVAPPSHRPVVDLVERDVTVIVTCHGRSVEDLEHTVYALAADERSARCGVVVVDDRTRAEIGALAGELGAVHLVRSGTEIEGFRAAAFAASTPLVLWLRAGDVTMPGAVAGLAAHFADPAVAVVQSSVGLLNPDSLVHLRGGRDEEAFEREVLGPALGRRGLAPWRGPASMVRVGHLVAAAARPGSTTTSDRWRRSLLAGRTLVVHEGRPLVRRRAADRLDHHLEDRRRLAAWRVDAVTWRGPRAARPARWSTVALSLVHLAGVRALLQAVLLVGVLLTAAVPVTTGVAVVAAAVGLAGSIGRRRLARSTMAFGDWNRQAWRSVGADTAGVVDALARRPAEVAVRRAGEVAGVRRLGRLRLLTAMVVVLDVALAIRGATLVWPDLLPRFTSIERVMVVGVAILALVPMLDVLQVAVRRRQRRAHHRLEVRLDVAIDGTHAHTIDLGPGGVGIRTLLAPAVGAEVAVTLLLDGEGSVGLVDALGVVRHVGPLPGGDHRVGVEFVAMDQASRAALFRYCAIDHPGRIDRREEPEPVVGPADLTVDAPRARGGAGVASGAAVMLGVAVVLAGPTAAPAFASGAPTAVCVVDSAGEPVVDARAEIRVPGAWQATGPADERGCFGAATGGSAAFRVWVNGRASVVRVDAAVAPEVTLSTVAVSVRVVDSAGAPLAGVRVDRHAGGWAEVGVTGADGVFVSEELPVRVPFRVWVNGRASVVRVDAATAPDATVSTVALSARVIEGLVGVHAGGWRLVEGSIELLPGRYRVQLADGTRPLIVLERPATAASPGDAPTPSPTAEPDAPAGSDSAGASPPPGDGSDTTIEGGTDGSDASGGSEGSDGGESGTIVAEGTGSGAVDDGAPTPTNPPAGVGDPEPTPAASGDPAVPTAGPADPDPDDPVVAGGWFEGGFELSGPSGTDEGTSPDQPGSGGTAIGGDGSAPNGSESDATGPGLDGDDVADPDPADPDLDGDDVADPDLADPADGVGGLPGADPRDPLVDGVPTATPVGGPVPGTTGRPGDPGAVTDPTPGRVGSSGDDAEGLGPDDDDDDERASTGPTGDAVVVIVRPIAATDGGAALTLDVDNVTPTTVDGPVFVDIPLDGETIAITSADGWSCDDHDGGVRCIHADPLPPGRVEAITVSVPSTAGADPDVAGTLSALERGLVRASAPNASAVSAAAATGALVVDDTSTGRGELVLLGALTALGLAATSAHRLRRRAA